MDLGPEDPEASMAAGGTPGPRAAQAAMAPRERRVILALRGPEAWLERLAAKGPRETVVCLDPGDPRELSGNLGSRGLGETPGTRVPVETQDNLAPRETLEGLDSATLAPEESPERKENQVPVALREEEETLA